MSGDMPKLWWSPCWGAVVGRAKHFEALESRRYFDELPSDAVELKPVTDSPVAPGETEWGVAMVAENDADWIEYTICQGETSARILADREPENRLMKRTMTVTREWQEVTDDV